MNQYKKLIISLVMGIASTVSSFTNAEGIVLGGTRVIYPAEQKQASLSVKNTSDKSRYLVQSWIEDAAGVKTSDFIVTPPLYVSNPGNENTLRLMYAGPELPPDRESLYYLTAKAIPSVDKNENAGKNVMLLAAATRIKLIVRPSGITLPVDKAPAQLQFKRTGKNVKISNPTPYYVTLVRMNVGGHDLKKSIMVSPYSDSELQVALEYNGEFRYSVINDYGGLSPEYKSKI